MAAAPVIPASPAPTPEPAPLSQGARIINTFIAPSKTFTDLRRSASWWAPWILISLATILFGYTIDRQVTFDQVTRNEIARSAKASEAFDKAPPDQQAAQMRFSKLFMQIAFYGSPATILLFDVIIGGILFAIFKFAAGADLDFGPAFAVMLYAGLAGIVGTLLGIVSLFSGINPEGFNINNPVGTNPAYYMDPAGSKFLLSFMSIFDVINIWTIALLGIGFACAGKLKRSTTIATVAGLYLVWKLAMAALAGWRG